jgi:hypothetical protein
MVAIAIVAGAAPAGTGSYDEGGQCAVSRFAAQQREHVPGVGPVRRRIDDEQVRDNAVHDAQRLPRAPARVGVIPRTVQGREQIRRPIPRASYDEDERHGFTSGNAAAGYGRRIVLPSA